MSPEKQKELLLKIQEQNAGDNSMVIYGPGIATESFSVYASPANYPKVTLYPDGTWEVHDIEESEEAETSADPQTENASQKLVRLASKHMVKTGLNYGHAAEYVLKTNPDLAKAYRDYTFKLATKE